MSPKPVMVVTSAYTYAKDEPTSWLWPAGNFRILVPRFFLIFSEKKTHQEIIENAAA
jgi:hypothetical protein